MFSCISWAGRLSTPFNISFKTWSWNETFFFFSWPIISILKSLLNLCCTRSVPCYWFCIRFIETCLLAENCTCRSVLSTVLYLLMCPIYGSYISAAQTPVSRLWFCDTWCCFGDAAYLICGRATFPLMERSCPFILAWNRTKSIAFKSKLNLWMGMNKQAELICGSTAFYAYFSAQWCRVRILTAVAVDWDSKFVISFSEELNASFPPRQFSNREEIRQSEPRHILNVIRFNYKNPASS